jgi:hypothetical protein
METKMKSVEYDFMTAANAAARKAHFAALGTVAMWRGRSATIQNRKHVANKAACRKPHRED